MFQHINPEIHENVKASVEKLRSIRREFTDLFWKPLETPCICATDFQPDTKYPICDVFPRFEPYHRPGMILHAYNHGGFRTFSDITTITVTGDPYKDWELLENARTARIVVASDEARIWLTKNYIKNKITADNSSYDDLYDSLQIDKKMRVLFMVDEYDWSWHIATRNMLRYWPEVCGDIIDLSAFNYLNHEMFDLIFVFQWGLKDILFQLPPEKTVVFLAGGMQLSHFHLLEDIAEKYHTWAARNITLKTMFEERFPHCSATILTNGIDTDHFRPKPENYPEHRDFTIGWVGNHTRDLKRFDAAQEITKKAGAKIKLAAYTDPIPHELMPRFYWDCDMLLITSETEAHPLVLYEAMSCGLPVVTTDVGDAREAVFSGVNGYIEDVDFKIDNVVSDVKYLKNNPDRRLHMGELARKAMLDKWTWETKVPAYREFVKRYE